MSTQLFSQDLRHSGEVLIPHSIIQAATVQPATRMRLESTFDGMDSASIASIAAARSGAANTLAKDLAASAHNRSNKHQLSSQDQTPNAIRYQLACAAIHRNRQTSAARALQIHFALAAALEAQRIADVTLSLLVSQSATQDKLVERGIPIPDPLLIWRTRNKVEDETLELQSKIKLLRIQLAGLVGGTVGCNHSPPFDPPPTPSDVDVCEYIEQGLASRSDLVSLIELRKTIRASTLDTWDQIGSTLGGLPYQASPRTVFSQLVAFRGHRSNTDRAVAQRCRWLEALIAERTQQITIEIETAFELKRSAALRWVKAQEQTGIWDERLRQLEKIGEAYSTLAEQSAAQISLLQSRASGLERWLDWHKSSIDLELAVGSTSY